MDAIDAQILMRLQVDGRISNTDLAKAVRLSPTPTLRRVRNLEDAGVITGYHARLDPAKVDRGFRALVWVDLLKSTRDAIDDFEEAVVEVPEVLEAHRLFGEPDYLLQVAVRDADAYERLYTSRLSILPGIRRAVSQITMKTVKSGGPLPVA